AQGAAMAIEDAGVLARAMREANGDPAVALPRWEAERKPRVARVVKRGAFNHFTWHARGPVALARDAVLWLRKPERLMADFDWLYGWDAET
ncbi:MAG: salicylate hydroxylase, partial [Notoacmeibacter sp.]|nr:salicylate hydroxylase [Notoacmeibacter sp.]